MWYTSCLFSGLIYWLDDGHPLSESSLQHLVFPGGLPSRPCLASKIRRARRPGWYGCMQQHIYILSKQLLYYNKLFMIYMMLAIIIINNTFSLLMICSQWLLAVNYSQQSSQQASCSQFWMAGFITSHSIISAAAIGKTKHVLKREKEGL